MTSILRTFSLTLMISAASLTCVGDVGGPHDAPDLLHALEVRTQPAVAAEDLLVHDGRHRQAVETVGEGFPQLDVVPPFACGEAIQFGPSND